VPVIEVECADLCSLIGMDVDLRTLLDRIPMLGADIEGHTKRRLNIEFFPDRPDLFSVEGLARALRGFLDIKTGPVEYPLAPPVNTLTVDKSVKGVRDFVVSAEVSGVKLDHTSIKSLMELQEDLHWGLGRDRRRAAIGVHDPARVKPPFRYTTVKPDGIRFVPLGMSSPMTPAEILKKHEKGREYAHIIDSCDRYPVILDANDSVLSLPPIINGELTKVTEATGSFFIDITGDNLGIISRVLNILTTAFAERGWRLRQVKVPYPDRTITTPDFSPETHNLDPAYVNRMLGTDSKPAEIAESLRRMGFGAKSGAGGIEVRVPCYRADVMHDIDLVEDVAIGMGYENLEGTLPEMTTTGRRGKLTVFCEKARRLMLGYGFTEAVTLMLTNSEKNFARMGLEGEAVEVKNPITEEHTMTRTHLLPSLLEVLQLNKHKELPQRVFEIGDVLLLDPASETGARAVRRLCAVATHPSANFTESKSLGLGLLRDLGAGDIEPGPMDRESFIPGRCAGVKGLGYFGEVHPKVITGFGLEYPVVALELDLERLLRP